MNTIVSELGRSPKFMDLLKNISNKKSPIEISGLTDVGESLCLSAINEYIKKPILIITYNEIQARRIVENIKYFTDRVRIFPKKEILTYDYIAESKELPYERIELLNKIYDEKNMIIVTTIEAASQKMIAKEELYKNTLKFKVGDKCNLDTLKKKLVDLGYVRYELIDGRGEFSIRGGIIDVSINETQGVRIELWGEEIDSIRYFNIVSQRSTNQVDEITIYPAHEYVLDSSIEEVCERIKDNIYEGKRLEILEKDIEEIRNGNYISKIDKYFNSFYKNQETILDYINNDCIICIDEKSKINARIESLKNDTESLIKALIEKEKIVPESIKNNLEREDINEILKKRHTIYLEKLNTTSNSGIERYNMNFKQLNYYKSSTDLFINDLINFQNDGKKVFIFVDMKEKVGKIENLLKEHNIQSRYEEELNQNVVNQSTAIITVGNLTEGCLGYDFGEVLIVANELVSAERRKRKFKREEFKQGEKIVFADLKVGDYVVHRNYGIGIYIGVNTITADGITRDYIKIKYLGDDILYIPTNALDSIRKYIGGEEIGLKLNKLGSKDWEKTTNKVKNNLRAVAKELIELYARREKAHGHAFSPDTEWQKEFEGKFPYIETDDQLRCIDEVKSDMEDEKPMDRLLCGDVGYGKTEVAIRAAFKSVMDQKQVVYLVPTTVLAKQQYETFKERMKDFPIKVELLNRFRTVKDQNRIIRELKLGSVDIVIGTHKLLGKDVEYKDLGLLIIDEEHRFGVKAKEKIKEYKESIDVLTMTATPIPRTLHMSVVGVRDMSVIYEPPQNRKPVQTYVLEYDQEVIREAIIKELERNGQVFYIFNNVENIMRKADEISRLVPEANVVYAHGRMSGSEIEDIMEDFVEGKSNVLVCTTILESGIDIPNANTIIVENADKMGLAQLYQIRGRVGRSERQGFAYITYKKDKILAEEADKRLKAIKEFTEFGSGFKIAMRDLEIRGAGSLIGEIQHGHLEEVGYDTYCRLLDEVLEEERGIKPKQELNVQIDLNVTSYIPDSYISDSNQKIEIYQDIALCKNEKDIEDITDELIDRFGNIPKEIEKLLEISRIKQLAKEKGIEKISNRRNNIIFMFNNDLFDNSIIDRLIKNYGNRINFSPGVKPVITLKIDKESEEEILKETKAFVKN